MMNEMTNVISTFLTEGQSTEINSGSIRVTYEKKNASDIQPEVNYNGSRIKIPPICELIGGDCSNRVIVQQVTADQLIFENNRFKFWT
jgi:hypothetical protein